MTVSYTPFTLPTDSPVLNPGGHVSTKKKTPPHPTPKKLEMT